MLNGRNWPATADSSSWSRLEDKLFERALAVFSENTPDRWEKIASQVPGKTWMEVRRHYEDLVHDVSEIDSGRVQLPNYCDDNEEEEEEVGDLVGTSDRVLLVSKGSREKETERRRGVAWTSGRAQAVSNWTGDIWKGRLEEYCKECSCLQNSGSSG